MNFESLPILRRGLMEWDKILLPKEEFLDREEAVRELMRKADVGAVAVFAKPGNDGDLCFLTNYTCNVLYVFRTAACVLGLESPTTLFVSSGPRDVPGIIARVPCKVETGEDAPKRAATFAAPLGERVGVVNLSNMPAGTQDAVERVLAGKMVDLTGPYKQMRASRRSTELAIMAQAGPMVVNQILAGFFGLGQGGGERELCAMIDRKLRINGCEDVSLLVASGNPPGSIRLPSGRRLQAGDSLQMFGAVQYRKSWVGAGRSAVVGKITPSQEALWSILSGVYESVLQGMKSGITLAEAVGLVERAGLELSSKGGYKLSYAGCQMIGLDFTEETGPIPDEEFELPCGCTLLVVLGASNESGDGFILGDTVELGPNEVRLLTVPAQRSLYVIPQDS